MRMGVKQNFPKGQEEQVAVSSGGQAKKGDPKLGPPFLAAGSLIPDLNKGTLVSCPYFPLLAIRKDQLDSLSSGNPTTLSTPFARL